MAEKVLSDVASAAEVEQACFYAGDGHPLQHLVCEGPDALLCCHHFHLECDSVPIFAARKPIQLVARDSWLEMITDGYAGSKHGHSLSWCCLAGCDVLPACTEARQALLECMDLDGA